MSIIKTRDLASRHDAGTRAAVFSDHVSAVLRLRTLGRRSKSNFYFLGVPEEEAGSGGGIGTGRFRGWAPGPSRVERRRC